MYPFRYRTAEIAFTLQGLTSLISALKKIPTSKGNCIVYIFFSFLFFLWRPFLFHVECWGNSKSTNLEAAYFLVSPFGWADSRRFRPNWTQFARRASSVHRFTTTTGLRCIFNQRNLIEEEGQTTKWNLLKQREEEVWVSFSIILHKLSAMAGTCDEFLLLITLACVPAVCVCAKQKWTRLATRMQATSLKYLYSLLVCISNIYFVCMWLFVRSSPLWTWVVYTICHRYGFHKTILSLRLRHIDAIYLRRSRSSFSIELYSNQDLFLHSSSSCWLLECSVSEGGSSLHSKWQSIMVVTKRGLILAPYPYRLWWWWLMSAAKQVWRSNRYCSLP